ncbi:MAG TPA: hypothetical protein VM598_08310, partial [Bdellovibrionota bacterium]|nr:hypothetical protein [Bdellovibrionota bacterium]
MPLLERFPSLGVKIPTKLQQCRGKGIVTVLDVSLGLERDRALRLPEAGYGREQPGDQALSYRAEKTQLMPELSEKFGSPDERQLLEDARRDLTGPDERASKEVDLDVP